jgi:hypothetical protein
MNKDLDFVKEIKTCNDDMAQIKINVAISSAVNSALEQAVLLAVGKAVMLGVDAKDAREIGDEIEFLRVRIERQR